MAEYPTRSNHYAHQLVRLMIRVCAAQEIGSDAFLLVTAIAHTEDAKRYTGPVTFWNEQLVSVLGFANWHRLDRARRRAIKAGWLHYEPGGKGRVGRYWCKIPPQYATIPDGPVDEDHPDILVGFDGASGRQTVSPVVGSSISTKEAGEKGDVSAERNGRETGEKGDVSADLSTLTQRPFPKKEKEGSLNSTTKTPATIPGGWLDDVEYPEGFDTPEVRASLAKILAHLRTKGRSYVDPAMQFSGLLKSEYAAQGLRPADFARAVSFSVGGDFLNLQKPNDMRPQGDSQSHGSMRDV